MKIAALSDVGLVRTRNEDTYWYDSDRNIFIVADGLGGHRAGNVAAEIAAKITAERMALAVDERIPDADMPTVLNQAFRVASEEIYQRSSESEEFDGMACSLVVTVIRGADCWVASAGDTRAYLCFDNTLSQMTVDDTPVAALVKRGYLLPEKALSHSLKNVLVKSVGSRQDVDANISKFPISRGDTLLLCSDGLWGMVSHPEISSILRSENEPQQACIRLAEAARNNGGQDNITMIVIRMDD